MAVLSSAARAPRAALSLSPPDAPACPGPAPGALQNCEMRTVVLSDGGGAGVHDATWFRGGEAYAEPQKAMLPNVKEKGKGNLLTALRLAWQGGRRGGDGKG